MSQKHPVIAVTGSSGVGTSIVKNYFEHIFHHENLNYFLGSHKFKKSNIKEKAKMLLRKLAFEWHLSCFLIGITTLEQ